MRITDSRAIPSSCSSWDLGAQLTLWPMPFVEELVGRGYRVIRYDNRDIGLSTKFDLARRPRPMLMVLASRFGLPLRPPYTLRDMANDAAGLLDTLGIDRAHIVGASMGGMIAQLFAIHHAGRTLSLTSIMSTTGNPKLPQAERDAMRALVTRPEGDDTEALVAHGKMMARTIGSPGYPIDDAELDQRVRETLARSHYPDGFTRQMAAIIADGDRRARLKRITAPTVVIHGLDDPLVPVAGGRDTAANIPGARLVEVPGMGHSLPVPLASAIADVIESVTKPGVAIAA